jgi:hypothetical protein
MGCGVATAASLVVLVTSDDVVVLEVIGVIGVVADDVLSVMVVKGMVGAAVLVVGVPGTATQYQWSISKPSQPAPPMDGFHARKSASEKVPNM